MVIYEIIGTVVVLTLIFLGLSWAQEHVRIVTHHEDENKEEKSE